MNVIRSKVPYDELLVGLGEECMELGQSALKLHRVFDGRNPTPITQDDAIERFHEEIADVIVYLKQFDIPWDHINETVEFKQKRWEDRLNGKA